MKILVTGSAGHLGEAIIRTLRGSEHETVGIDILESTFTDRTGSIVDRDFVKDCMEGAEAVLHTATLHTACTPARLCAKTAVPGRLGLLGADRLMKQLSSLKDNQGTTT